MHKLLQRQLARAFGAESFGEAESLGEAEMAGDGAAGRPASDSIDSPALARLLAAVDEAYAAADDDRLMLERSLDITSQIMLKKNEELRAARDAAEAAKDKAERADREKGLLLKEIHHRVKNNLQVIVSLLSLQADSKDHEGYHEFIGEATGRIMSMAMIHEILYEGGDFSSIDFSTYAERIARNAARASETESCIDLGLEPVALALDEAVPCGLIINEALTNAFKYGKGKDGRVHISLRLSWDGPNIVMEVADSGPGFPDDFAEAKGLGHTLMASLAEQIQGDIGFENHGGARVRLVLNRS